MPHHTLKVPQTGAESTNNPPVPLPALSLDLKPHFSYSGLLRSQFLIQIPLPQDASFDLPCSETSSLKNREIAMWWWGGAWKGRNKPLLLFLPWSGFYCFSAHTALAWFTFWALATQGYHKVSLLLKAFCSAFLPICYALFPSHSAVRYI